MGKLTVSDANELLDKGIITKETLTKMQNDGLVSTRSKSAERYIQSSIPGVWVTPIFYYRGKGGAKYTPEMTELRTKVSEVIEKYTVTKHEVVNAETKNKKNSKGKNGK